MAMSQRKSLHQITQARFHKAFGKPQNVGGRGEQWTLRPSGDYKAEIHVLLNGAPDLPAVWVFDPHVANSVMNTCIVQQSQIADIIKLIQSQVSKERG
jgi:hypothetical protein